MIIKASLSKGVKYAFVSIQITNGFYYIFETRRKVTERDMGQYIQFYVVTLN